MSGEPGGRTGGRKTREERSLCLLSTGHRGCAVSHFSRDTWESAFVAKLAKRGPTALAPKLPAASLVPRTKICFSSERSQLEDSRGRVFQPESVSLLKTRSGVFVLPCPPLFLFRFEGTLSAEETEDRSWDSPSLPFSI